MLCFSIMNICGRPAYEVEASCRGLGVGWFSEAIGAEEARTARIGVTAPEPLLRIRYDDLQSGRISEVRQFALDDGVVGVGRRKAGVTADPAESHIMDETSADEVSK